MNELSKLYSPYQGKNIFLQTKSGRKYETSNFQIVNDSFAVFNDKFGFRVTIVLSEISRIEEVSS